MVLNLALKYRPICSFRNHTFQYQGLFGFADVSIFYKKLAFSAQNSTFNESNSVRAVLKSFRQYKSPLQVIVNSTYFCQAIILTLLGNAWQKYVKTLSGVVLF